VGGTTRGKPERIITECRRRRKQRDSYEAASDHLLDYTQPEELLKIMMMHWDQVASVFGQGKDDWETPLQFASKVRVALAHHRQEEVSRQNLDRLRVTCQEMLRWLAAPARRG
jgi:hypothetical protein